MRKIKDKIIKMLGGVPKKEFTKEVQIANKQGAACAYRTIKDYVITCKIDNANDCFAILSKLHVYIHDRYESVVQDIYILQNS